MKKIAIIVFCLSIQPLFAQQADVKKTIETFFEAFHAQDTVKLKSVFAKDMVLHSVAETKTGGKLSVESASDMLASIASVPKDVKFEEKLLSWEIKVDGSMAHVWTPYEFYINGKMSHSGVNSFMLFKDNGVWKIVYCIDTRRRA